MLSQLALAIRARDRIFDGVGLSRWKGRTAESCSWAMNDADLLVFFGPSVQNSNKKTAHMIPSSQDTLTYRNVSFENGKDTSTQDLGPLARANIVYGTKPGF